MPWIKQTKPLATLRRLLIGYGVTARGYSNAAGYSFPTAKKRLDDPRLMPLEDLLKITQAFHIPIEEVREAIKIEK